MELVLLSKSGGSELVLTDSMVDHRKINLLENHLVLSCSSKLVLAPSSGETCCSIKDLVSGRKTGRVNMLVKNKFSVGEENSKVILEISSIKLWMNGHVLNISVLMRIGFSLMLGVPFSTSDLQFCWVLSELVDTMSSCQDDSRGNQGTSALVQVDCLWLSSAISGLLLYRLGMEDSTHMRPFSKLRLGLGKSLDSGSKTVEVSSSALGLVFDNWWWWWRNKVRILAADIKEARTLAVFWSQGSESVSDVNKTCSVSDDGSIGTLVVRNTHVPKLFGVVGTVLMDCIYLNSSFGLTISKGRIVRGVVIGILIICILDDLNQNINIGVCQVGSVTVSRIINLLFTGTKYFLNGSICVIG